MVVSDKPNGRENGADEDNEVSVTELIAFTCQGDQRAFSLLCKKYEGMINALVSSFSSRIPSEIFSREDLHQECLMAFYRATCSYKFSEDVTFGLYAKTCVRNAMISLLRKSLSIKRKQAAAQKKREVKSEKDVLTVMLEASAGQEELSEVGRAIFAMLTDFEKEVLRCYTKKMSYAQMAKKLSVSTKAVDNALYRIRKKIKKAGIFKAD